MNLLFNATTIPSALMFAALNEQDFLCRVFRRLRCRRPARPRNRRHDSASRGPLTAKLFRYARYNAELTPRGSEALGCGDVDPASVQKLDSIDALGSLQRVGKAVAREKVNAKHFNLDVFKP